MICRTVYEECVGNIRKEGLQERGRRGTGKCRKGYEVKGKRLMEIGKRGQNLEMVLLDDLKEFCFTT